MELNERIKEIKPYQLNCNVFDVYSYDGLSIQDLLCQFFTKLNECISTSNETINLVEWLVDVGLEEEVVKKLMMFLEDGTIKNLINDDLFNSLNTKVDNLNYDLKSKPNKDHVWHMENMGQDVKTAMTGGSVAVVGENAITTNNIKNKQVTPNKTTFIKRINLFDKDTNVEIGKRISYPEGGYITDDAFFTSDFIEVNNNNDYGINIANYDTIFHYNNKKELVDKTSLTGWGLENNIVKFNNNVKYIRISALKQYINEIMFVEGNSIPSNYFSYNELLIPNLKYNYNGLKGTYLFTGDSICEGGYPQLIKNINYEMNVVNYGIGGTLITKQEGRNDSILERVDTMQDDADFIVLEGGLNDAWTSVALGEFNPSNLTSGYISGLNEYEFTGALESLINKCQNKWVGKKIFFVIPHNVDIPNTKTYMDRIVEVCQKWSVIVIDLRKLSGFNCYNETIKTTYTNNADGVHPNKEGYKRYYVEPITNILKQYTIHN